MTKLQEKINELEITSKDEKKAVKIGQEIKKSLKLFGEIKESLKEQTTTLYGIFCELDTRFEQSGTKEELEDIFKKHNEYKLKILTKSD